MSCIGFTNLTQRAQIVSREACESKLPFTPINHSETKRYRLSEMAKSESAKIRSAAASNPMLDPSDLAMLAFDEAESVRGWALRNPTMGIDLIRAMYKDESAAIRAYARFLLKED